MTTRTRRIVGGSILAALVAAAVVAHLRGSRTPKMQLHHLIATVDYLPGIGADVFLPPVRPHRAPVVVLVPGGSWRSADRTGLRPLADVLAGAGFVAVTASYRVGEDDARYPVPVQDIECAVSFAVHRARAVGVTADPVVLAGHSAGAQLAALASLGTAGPARSCPYPPALPDGFVGLSGPYDQLAIADLAVPLFGMQHVSPTFSTMFADALRKGGHAVRLTMVNGANHASIYTPHVCADPIVAWVKGLAA